MARDSSGNYTLPAGNPVVTGTPIASDGWANPTLDDLSNEITNSLDRNGRGGMLAPFRFVDGSGAAPGMSWTSEPGTGFYRAFSGDQRVTVSGADQFRWTSAGAADLRNTEWHRVATEKHFSADAETVGKLVSGDATITRLFANDVASVAAFIDGVHSANEGSPEFGKLSIDEDISATPTRRAYVGYDGSVNLGVANEVNGGAILLTANNDAGTPITGLSFDPQALVIKMSSNQVDISADGATDARLNLLATLGGGNLRVSNSTGVIAIEQLASNGVFEHVAASRARDAGWSWFFGDESTVLQDQRGLLLRPRSDVSPGFGGSAVFGGDGSNSSVGVENVSSSLRFLVNNLTTVAASFASSGNGTFNGICTFVQAVQGNTAPTAPAHLTRKDYVDSQVSGLQSQIDSLQAEVNDIKNGFAFTGPISAPTVTQTT